MSNDKSAVEWAGIMNAIWMGAGMNEEDMWPSEGGNNDAQS